MLAFVKNYLVPHFLFGLALKRMAPLCINNSYLGIASHVSMLANLKITQRLAGFLDMSSKSGRCEVNPISQKKKSDRCNSVSIKVTRFTMEETLTSVKLIKCRFIITKKSRVKPTCAP